MAPPSATDPSTSPPPSPSLKKSNPTIGKPELKTRTTNGITQSSAFPTPLTYAGSLDTYESFDTTSVIGREFPKLQLTDILSDDEKVRDLAILVSQRGVVFFRNQELDVDGQKILGQRLGELTGKPESSKVCI